ncbi:MAG: hypothetical protein ACK5TR_06950 [Alphaproteobacteria bacterium]|jgi:hypothetical protein|nr:hypothetical protein [Alphaproteobacteria bacterium]
MKCTLNKFSFVVALLSAAYGHASTPPTIQCPDLSGKTIKDIFGDTLPPMEKPAKDVALPGLSGWKFTGFVTRSVFKETNTFQLIGHSANVRCNYYVVENGGHKGTVAFTQDPNAAPAAEPAAEPTTETAAKPTTETKSEMKPEAVEGEIAASAGTPAAKEGEKLGEENPAK